MLSLIGRRKFTIAFQLFASFVQYSLPTIPGFPQEWVPFFHTLVSLGQLAQALIAGERNPDGTPSSVAYLPKGDK